MKLIRRNEKAMGSPRARKNINPPSKNDNVIHHSIAVSPSYRILEGDV
jgi:hypothetical protein